MADIADDPRPPKNQPVASLPEAVEATNVANGTAHPSTDQVRLFDKSTLLRTGKELGAAFAVLIGGGN